MYSIEGIRKGLAQPRYILQEANRQYHRRLYTRSHNTAGIDVIKADWDNLVVLDACRYDLFERVSTLPGELSAVESRGSSTREWLGANFGERDMLDTVYVTASPMFHRHQESIGGRFHAVVDVWRDYGWDPEFRTVLPETMTEAALEAAERYPNKRLLVHYLQPHYPFLGPTGRANFDLDRLDFQWDEVATDTLGISRDVVVRAYEENLDVVLPSVERLLHSLGGKTVVTADHGQALGERSFPVPMREYGHPPSIYTEALVKVPWLVHENGPRRRIVAEEPVDHAQQEQADDESESVAQERLEALGYID
jgi:hypothetical protein